MKELGETIFDILYLVSVLSMGFYIISVYRKKEEQLMGYSLVTLGFGDAFHLIPRIVSYKLSFNFASILGMGKLITSITMSVFYVFLYYIYLHTYKVEKNKNMEYTIWFLLIIRVILYMFVENNWLSPDGSLTWSIIRNIPFVILGIIIVILYFQKRKEDNYLKYLYLFIILSYIFYIPVVIFASTRPIVGMLMIPKSICYILIAISFLRKVKNKISTE